MLADSLGRTGSLSAGVCPALRMSCALDWDNDQGADRLDRIEADDVEDWQGG